MRKAILGERAWLSVHQLNPHYLWMIPASNVMIFGTVGIVLGLVAWFRPTFVSRLSTGIYWSLFVAALISLTHTFDQLACASLAAGTATLVMRLRNSQGGRFRSTFRYSVAGLIVLAIGFVGLSEWRERTRAAASSTPGALVSSQAPNVLLIVLDTVRADALSAYGSARKTSPHMARLAQQGVRFEHARSAAPWTLASIASMLTGHWPFQLSVGPESGLDRTYPTLAEFLSGHGYATAGFTANYIFGTRLYGLDRGFSHYEERGVSFEDILGSSELGRHLFPLADRVGFEWSRLMSRKPEPNAVDLRYSTRRRTAAELNRSFLSWLSGQKGRPFFAFLNYFDAHAPYLPPSQQQRHFGLVPETRADYEMLRNWDEDRMKGLWGKEKSVPPTDRERTLARDVYDDCIAYMDQQVARLMMELDRRGLRRNTMVIITADHGEEFGENGLYGHFLSLHRAELDVPLMIIDPARAPANRTISEPVSLRNLPATVIDHLGLSARSPFPGRSLARFWNPATGPETLTDEPVLSELSTLSLRALLSGTKVYIHHGDGIEQLFDQKTDPWETSDLVQLDRSRPDLEHFREMLSHLKAPGRVPGSVHPATHPKAAMHGH